jgi:hypothetical protein
MPSKHIKLEILLVSIIIFILLTDYTLLIGHPSTRVGLITQNISHLRRNDSSQTTKNMAGRRLAATEPATSHTDGYFKKPITITDTPSIEIKFGTITLEFLPRQWWIDAAREIFDSTNNGFAVEKSRTEELLEAFAGETSS